MLYYRLKKSVSVMVKPKPKKQSSAPAKNAYAENDLPAFFVKFFHSNLVVNRGLPLLFISVFAAIGVYCLVITHAATVPPTSNQNTVTGNITSGYNGYCLDDKNGDTSDGNPIDLWSCNGSTSQDWTTYSSSGTPDEGTIEIFGKCLAVAGGSTINYAVVELDTCDGTPGQQWVWSTTQNIIQNTGSGKCLSVPFDDKNNGTQLAIETCTTDNLAQTWTMPAQSATPTPTPSPSPTPTPTPAPAPTPTPTPVTSSPEVSTTSTPLTENEIANLNDEVLTPPGVSLTTNPFVSPPAPSISHLQVTNITETTAVVSWQTNLAAGYTLKYGTNPQSLTVSIGSQNAMLTNKVTLMRLPSGKKIYLTITPSSSGSSGSTVGTSFQTSKNYTYLMIVISIGIILAVLLLLLIFRKKPGHRAPSDTEYSQPITEPNNQLPPPAKSSEP